ncbi:peptide/nickel transport system substrate-binding protein [Micromonospora kangleipakensis]|uniref:Peptide/nickel transport system substrate-binding protein n=1 Tax=Micromonospora kangleipakensis TaxID=1077942 RepID=A0A4Q8BED1_9ACTN|nr:ABC transporter substrate-binding protein [Micromonospora kangleipakensis]RZU75695.1 peptide/nickel transport system substrate-binding protein [Micromonospora kangleipakensis]
MRAKTRTLTCGVLAAALVAAGCSPTTDSGGGGNDDKAKTQTGSISYDAADNQGPAKAVDGATKGGTLTVMQVADFEHLDPARNYVNVQQVTGGLIYRSLNGYKEDGTGKLLLVGDLATDPGKDVNKDCKVWEFTLREGVKYEDGSPVTSKDVAYGIARSYSANLNEGPHYIQQWLYPGGAYNAKYQGPYDGGRPAPDGIETPDDRTIRFTFQEPHCDMPYAAALPTSAPVPAAKDTRANYDLRPFSSGPYRVKSYQRDVALELERNPHWDPQTDPLRTAYPDAIKVTFGLEQAQIAERLVADAPADQASLSWTDVPPAVLPRTTSGTVAERVIKGPTQYTWVLDINTQRVTDLNVRKALNYAVDKDAALKAIGGQAAGSPATTLMSPTTAGWKKYDVFNAPVTGDKQKVRELLGGKGPKLVLAHVNTELRTQQAEAIRKNLTDMGFTIVMKPIEQSSYYDEIGRKNNPYDLYLSGWGSDWPTGSTVIPPLYDGREIGPEGNNNLSYLNEPGVNAEIDRVRNLPAAEQDAAWMALDEKIMREHAPVVPCYYDATYELRGSKIGNAFLSDAFGIIQLNTIYVKQ